MQEKDLRELGRAPQALPFPSFPPQQPGPAPRPAVAASGTPLPGRAGPRYLDLAVEQAGALHDLLRGHLQHLLADAILRGTTAPSPRAPRRAPRAPSPRSPAPAPHLRLVPHRRHLPSPQRPAPRRRFLTAGSPRLPPRTARRKLAATPRGPRGVPATLPASLRAPLSPPSAARSAPARGESAGGGGAVSKVLRDGPAAISGRSRPRAAPPRSPHGPLPGAGPFPVPPRAAAGCWLRCGFIAVHTERGEAEGGTPGTLRRSPASPRGGGSWGSRGSRWSAGTCKARGGWQRAPGGGEGTGQSPDPFPTSPRGATLLSWAAGDGRARCQASGVSLGVFLNR